MTSSVSNEVYVISGASGNTGSIVANSLRSAGKKVRVVGRDSGRLQRFVDKGAPSQTSSRSASTGDGGASSSSPELPA